jgi:hypothetical protein
MASESRKKGRRHDWVPVLRSQCSSPEVSNSRKGLQSICFSALFDCAPEHQCSNLHRLGETLAGVCVKTSLALGTPVVVSLSGK